MADRNPKLSKVEVLYTKRHRLYNVIFMKLFRYDKGVVVFFREHNYLKNSSRVLDAGCGSGTVTKALRAAAQTHAFHNIQYHAFDITPVMLEQFNSWVAKEQLQNVATRRANVLEASNLPQSWRNFDLIVSSGMLEYLPKDKLPNALRNLRQRLAVDGKLLIFISKQNTLNHWLIEKWWKANTYSQRELEVALTEAGFQKFRFVNFNTYLNAWGFVIEVTK